MYAAFGRGDVPAILEHLAEDVAWEPWSDNHAQVAGVPWLQPFHRRADVVRFFEEIGRWQIHSFAVLDIMAGERQVASEVTIDATLPSGRRYRDEEMHLWTFGPDGKVIRFRHYADTAKQIHAAGLVPVQPPAA
jgi:ketosteroid isomerase-like protein